MDSEQNLMFKILRLSIMKSRKTNKIRVSRVELKLNWGLSFTMYMRVWLKEHSCLRDPFLAIVIFF